MGLFRGLGICSQTPLSDSLFLSKIHTVIFFWGELTFHAWKAWYQNDLKFIKKLTNCQEYNLNN